MSGSRRLRRPLNWPARNTLPNALNDVLPVLSAAIVVNEFLVVAVLCNNTLDTELTIISFRSSGSVSVRAMVNPCPSAFWDLDLRFHRCRWVHHSFQMLCSSSMPSGTVTFRACRLARSTRSRHQPSCPPNVPDSELQASVFHTRDVGTGGWGDCRCAVPIVMR